MSLVVRKLAFCICENKDADQLRGNCEADHCLCFSYIDSTIPLLPIYEISSLLLPSEDRFSHNEAQIVLVDIFSGICTERKGTVSLHSKQPSTISYQRA